MGAKSSKVNKVSRQRYSHQPSPHKRQKNKSADAAQSANTSAKTETPTKDQSRVEVLSDNISNKDVVIGFAAILTPVNEKDNLELSCPLTDVPSIPSTHLSPVEESLASPFLSQQRCNNMSSSGAWSNGGMNDLLLAKPNYNNICLHNVRHEPDMRGKALNKKADSHCNTSHAFSIAESSVLSLSQPRATSTSLQSHSRSVSLPSSSADRGNKDGPTHSVIHRVSAEVLRQYQHIGDEAQPNLHQHGEYLHLQKKYLEMLEEDLMPLSTENNADMGEAIDIISSSQTFHDGTHRHRSKCLPTERSESVEVHLDEVLDHSNNSSGSLSCANSQRNNTPDVPLRPQLSLESLNRVALNNSISKVNLCNSTANNSGGSTANFSRRQGSGTKSEQSNASSLSTLSASSKNDSPASKAGSVNFASYLTVTESADKTNNAKNSNACKHSKNNGRIQLANRSVQVNQNVAKNRSISLITSSDTNRKLQDDCELL